MDLDNNKDLLSAINRAARAVTGALVDMSCCPGNGKIISVASPEQASSIRLRAVPTDERPLEAVVTEAKDIFSYRAAMNHPRFFGFIPSPISPISWLGEMISTAFNVHAGSWLQSSGPSAVEDALIALFAEKAGLPSSAGGIFLSGGSMANMTALMVARDTKLHSLDRGRAVIYLSEQTHSSVAKGLRILGFLNDQLRKLPADEKFQMDVSALKAAISKDRAAGLLPLAVVASCGTTNTGSIDPLSTIADVAEMESLWMHVDGAYGASIVLSQQHHSLAVGLSRADSISWDAHKWLFQTYACGMVLVRERKHLLQTFANEAEYLRDAVAGEDTPNFWSLGPELTRPARAMKLWFTLQVLGTRKVGEMIDHGVMLVETAERELRKLPDWEIVSPASLAIMTFRYAPKGLSEMECDQLNVAISKQLIADNFAAILTTQLAGRTVLRICAIHPGLAQTGIIEVVQVLNEVAREIQSSSKVDNVCRQSQSTD
jgi:L-2,4-diaminobutyrate decarboxylase